MKFCDNEKCINHVEVDKYADTLKRQYGDLILEITKHQYVLRNLKTVWFCNSCHNAIQMRNTQND